MDVFDQLIDILGKDKVSGSQEELFIYSRDSGAQLPRHADYVVMPETVEDVQKVVLLANREKIPITPSEEDLRCQPWLSRTRAGSSWT